MPIVAWEIASVSSLSSSVKTVIVVRLLAASKLIVLTFVSTISPAASSASTREPGMMREVSSPARVKLLSLVRVIDLKTRSILAWETASVSLSSKTVIVVRLVPASKLIVFTFVSTIDPAASSATTREPRLIREVSSPGRVKLLALARVTESKTSSILAWEMGSVSLSSKTVIVVRLVPASKLIVLTFVSTIDPVASSARTREPGLMREVWSPGRVKLLLVVRVTDVKTSLSDSASKGSPKLRTSMTICGFVPRLMPGIAGSNPMPSVRLPDPMMAGAGIRVEMSVVKASINSESWIRPSAATVPGSVRPSEIEAWRSP